MFVGVQSNKTPHSGRPPRMNADGQNTGRTPPAPNHGRCQRSTARSAETGLAAASASVTRRGALLRPGFARRGPRRRVPTERDLFRALAMRVFRCWSFRPLPKPGGRGRTLRVGLLDGGRASRPAILEELEVALALWPLSGRGAAAEGLPGPSPPWEAPLVSEGAPQGQGAAPTGRTGTRPRGASSGPQPPSRAEQDPGACPALCAG